MLDYKNCFVVIYFMIKFDKKTSMKHLTIILLFVFSLCIAQPPDYGEDDKAESKTKIAHASLGNPYLTSDAPASRGNAHLVIPKMNVLYVGIPNLLKIEIPDPSETYSLSSSTLSFGEGLKFTQGETKYDFIVTPQRATHNRGIIVNVLNSKGIIVATKNIRVKRLPDPTTTILGQKSGLISRGKIKVASRIDAKISNFDYEIKVQVSSFTMEV